MFGLNRKRSGLIAPVVVRASSREVRIDRAGRRRRSDALNFLDNQSDEGRDDCTGPIPYRRSGIRVSETTKRRCASRVATLVEGGRPIATEIEEVLNTRK